MTLADILRQTGDRVRIPRTVRPRPIFVVVGACLVGCAAGATYAFTGDMVALLMGVSSVTAAIAALLWPSRCTTFDLKARHIVARGQNVQFGERLSLRVEAQERRGDIVVTFYVLVCDVDGMTLDITESDHLDTVATIARYVLERLRLPHAQLEATIASARR